MFNLTVGTELHPADKAHVLNAFVYRMTHESVRNWPQAARQMRDGGFAMSIIDDATWLAHTYFHVRKDGRLDRRHNACCHHALECRTVERKAA